MAERPGLVKVDRAIDVYAPNLADAEARANEKRGERYEREHTAAYLAGIAACLRAGYSKRQLCRMADNVDWRHFRAWCDAERTPPGWAAWALPREGREVYAARMQGISAEVRSAI